MAQITRKQLQLIDTGKYCACKSENAQSFRSPSFPIARHSKPLLIFRLFYRATSTFRSSSAIIYSKKWTEKSWPMASHIYPLLTVYWSYLTIVYNRIIWSQIYFNSLNSRSFSLFSPFVPLCPPIYVQA
jgi:hypothetical protein